MHTGLARMGPCVPGQPGRTDSERAHVPALAVQSPSLADTASLRVGACAKAPVQPSPHLPASRLGDHDTADPLSHLIGARGEVGSRVGASG